MSHAVQPIVVPPKRADETDEEKRARRLAKKAAKRAKESAAMGGYADDDNPWNDPNLTEQFVWGKKVERERKVNGSAADSASSAEVLKRKRMDQLRELEKAKQARVQREQEREAWEAERVMLEREREQMAFADNEKREEEFQLKQTYLRARIRAGEGRGKPIDLLSESLSLLFDDADPDTARDIKPQDPLSLFENLTRRELRELLEDICRCAQLDMPRRSFWSALRALCEHHMAELEESGGHGSKAGFASALNSAVSTDVAQMLASKSAAELDELREQITAQLQDDEAVDTDYWRTVQQQLELARARCIVKETHRTVLARKAELMAAAGSAEDPRVASEVAAAAAGVPRAAAHSSSEPALDGRYSPLLEEDDEGAGDAGAFDGADAGEVSGSAESGRYSPVLLQAYQVASETVISTEDDWRTLQEERARVRQHADARRHAAKPGAAGATATTTRVASEAPGTSILSGAGGTAAGDPNEEDALVDAEAKRGMEQGEARFSFEVPLERKITWWHDKYRPRKPKYFNRVHTGYEWNKYNQTHYDHDNPPPKMVQGYKFAIFYPDLIDRTQTPTYSLLPDPSGAKDTCLLRFRGGPPYEDIAFKIVNNEWEHSHKRGFKCRFDRGILQLHFNFKRHRYRR